MSNKITFVFEVSNNAASHQWHTWHDDAKYETMFASCSAAIKEAVPGAECIQNKVPKPWYEKEVYCQLIPNEDDNNPHYDILPRCGAFEISTVINNVDILFYSKQMSSMWPSASLVAKRIAAAMEDSKKMDANALREKYYTTGR